MASIPPSTAFRSLAPDAPLSAAMAQELLKRAHRLKTASHAGHPALPLLQGKNLAVLQPASADTESTLHDAAADLGLRVARVSLGEPPPEVAECARIARMLGRMYDAIDVGATAPAAAAELATHAGVPVYRGLADGSHPALALVLDGNTVDPTSDRRFLLQALLLASLV